MVWKKWSLMLACVCLIGACHADPQTSVEIGTFDFPPFMQEEGGQVQGALLKIVREAFQRMRVHANIQFYPAQRSILLMEEGKLDGLFSVKKTAAREKILIFGQEPLLQQEYAIFVPADSRLTFDGNLAKLKSITLGVVRRISYGARFDQAVANGAFQNLEYTFSFESNFRKLLAHRMDALISNRVVGLAMLRRLDAMDKIKVIGPPVETVNSYMTFYRVPANQTLSRQFDQALHTMKRDGTYQRMLDQES